MSEKTQTASTNDVNHLRTVTMRPYVDQSIAFTLNTWDGGGRVDGKYLVRYEFSDQSGTVIFAGSDFACSPMNAIDSDESLRALLGFLTLRPGDTDPEYFDDYTPAQMAFADEHAETLSMYAQDEESQPFDETDQDAEVSK